MHKSPTFITRFFILLFLACIVFQNKAATQYDEMEGQINRMVKLYVFMLNTMGGNNTSERDRQIILETNHLKLFQNSEVMVEDDLVPNRKVPVYKPIVNYLEDVRFFYKWVKFDYVIEEIVKNSKSGGDGYYVVTVKRTLEGVNLEGKQQIDERVLYMDINIVAETGELKIAGIYITPTEQKNNLLKWWQSLDTNWKGVLSKAINDLTLNEAQLAKRATEITSLDLSHTMAVDDFTPLSMLKGLEDLNLSNSSFNDVELLLPLRNLKSLNLSSTYVSQIENLVYLKNLEMLFLDNTSIATIVPLFSLDNLKGLYCRQTKVPAYEIENLIYAMPNMEIVHDQQTHNNWWPDLAESWKDVFSKELNLEGREPTITDMALIENITSLDLSGNKRITSLQPLQHLKELKELNISNTDVPIIDFIVLQPKLEKLDISSNWITDISPLFLLEDLKVLNIDDIQAERQQINNYVLSHPNCKVISHSVEHISWFVSLPAAWKSALKKAAGYEADQNLTTEEMFDLFYIKELDLSGNSDIHDLTPLTKLFTIESLNISNTMHVKSLEPLRNLQNLRFLDCSYNPIEDLSPLSDLHRLEELVAVNTYVSSLEPLQDLQGLRKLDFTGSRITDLRDIRELSNLEDIKFSNTDVKSLNPLLTALKLSYVTCYNTRLNPKDVESFEKSKPQTKVVFY